MLEISKLSLGELRKFAERVKKEIATRADREVLRQKLTAMAEQNGMKLEEVLRESPVQKIAAPRRKAPVKYVHPSNRKLAWSGRGSKPAWVKVWLEHGGSMDALETAALKLGNPPRV